jgi:serine/threonine-protein kinase
MGIVFEAVNVLTEHRFALKWLTVEDDEVALRRFRREARLAGRIQHSHVVDVYDIHVDTASCFLVMQLLDGESLAKRLARLGPLTLAEARDVMLPCLAGLGAAHAMGVIHRDIKPDNIFLCCTDVPHVVHPKILDFGISRVVQGLGEPNTTETREGVVLGTPLYMAPEQLLSRPCDARVDVYALGVSLYEMLCGQHAFSASSYPELIKKILDGDATPLESHIPDVSPEVVSLITRAMHCSPDRRFQNVDALRDALLEMQVPDTEPELRLRTRSQQIQTTRVSGRPSRARWWVPAIVVLTVGCFAGALWLRLSRHATDVNIVKPRIDNPEHTAVRAATSVTPPSSSRAAEPLVMPAQLSGEVERRAPTNDGTSVKSPQVVKRPASSVGSGSPGTGKRKPQPREVEQPADVPENPYLSEQTRQGTAGSKPKVVIDGL